MAVIQDEQGNNKPIVTDTSHVFDVNGNPLHGELFIGETIASDDVEEIDPFAHMSDVEGLITTTTITQTTTASGNIGLPINTNNHVLLNVTATTNSRLALPWENAGVYTVKILKADLSIAASESVTVRYSYKAI